VNTDSIQEKYNLGNDETWVPLGFIWEMNKHEFDAVSENGSIVHIIGFSGGKVYGWALKWGRTMKNRDRCVIGKSHVRTFDAERHHWKLYEKPEAVPHWPAIRRGERVGVDRYDLTSTLYATEEHARQFIHNFVSLAKHLPPAMLPPIEF